MPAFRVFVLTLFLSSQLACRAQKPNANEQSPRKIPLLEAIAELGLRTQQPLGIVFGENGTALCEFQTTLPPNDLTAREALEQIAELARYAVEEHDGVLVMIAPDITPHQRDLLSYRTERFEEGPRTTMRKLSSDMTGWLWLFADNGGGYGTSFGDAVGAYEITIPPLTDVTTEQIADRAMTIGAGGIWLLRASGASARAPSDDRIDFLSYAAAQSVRADTSCR